MPTLRSLVAAGLDVVRVVTRADKRRSRRGAPGPSPVKAAAHELGVEVTHDLADVSGGEVDLGVVVAYGRLVPRAVLEQLAMVNLHFSLLPRWRGAAPVERAILAGDDTTGVCLMGLAEGLDTGPVYACVERAIDPRTTAERLRADLAGDAAELAARTLIEGLDAPCVQQGEVTHADKITPEDRQLDPHRPAAELDRVVRIGGAWTTLRGRRLQVISVRPVTGHGEPGTLDGTTLITGDGGLELLEVRPEGRATQPAEAWLRGARLGPTDRLGS